MAKVLPTLLLFLLFGGCTSTSFTYEEPDDGQQEEPTTRLVVDKSFDDTWDALIAFTSQHFFGIQNYEKASGLLTLEFSARADEWVDCGSVNIIEDRGGWPDRSNVVSFLEYADGQLRGRVNLTAVPLNEEETEVRVNAVYTVNAQNRTWSFATRDEDSKRLSNQRQEEVVKCVPTHRVENFIIEGISAL